MSNNHQYNGSNLAKAVVTGALSAILLATPGCKTLTTYLSPPNAQQQIRMGDEITKTLEENNKHRRIYSTPEDTFIKIFK